MKCVFAEKLYNTDNFSHSTIPVTYLKLERQWKSDQVSASVDSGMPSDVKLSAWPVFNLILSFLKCSRLPRSFSTEVWTIRQPLLQGSENASGQNCKVFVVFWFWADQRVFGFVDKLFYNWNKAVSQTLLCFSLASKNVMVALNVCKCYHSLEHFDPRSKDIFYSH